MKTGAMNQQGRNFRLQVWVAVCSTLLLVAKFVAYFLTYSVAVLTDALESIVNVAAAFISLYSLYVSAKPRDRDHPYGHGKAEFVSAAVEGTLVLGAGAAIFYKAVTSFIAPVPITRLDTGIWLLGATAVVNWLLGYHTHRQGTRSHSLALAASGRHLQADSYSTGVLIAGLLLVLLTGRQWIDPLLAVLFGFFLVYTGYGIIRKSLAGIMDEADMGLLTAMVGVLNDSRRDSWVDLHNLRVIKYGNVLHVDCHLTVPWYLNINEAHAEIDVLAGRIRGEFGESLELFVHSDGCQYFQCPICDKRNCPVRQHPFQKEIVWTLDNILQNEKHGPGDGPLKNEKHEDNHNVERGTGF